MQGKDNYKKVKNILYYLSKILSWSCFLILFLIVGFFIYYFSEAKIAASQGRIHEPTISLYSILTGSMEPNVRVDDVVFSLRPSKPEDLKVGDVITFISNNPHTKGVIITHRITDIDKDESGYFYYTKGDANPKEDNSTTPYANVIGKVVFKIPKLGLVKKIVSNRAGWILLVLIPALCVIIYDSYKLLKTIKLNNKSKIIATQEKVEEKKDVSELKRQLLEKRNSFPDIKSTDLPKLRD